MRNVRALAGSRGRPSRRAIWVAVAVLTAASGVGWSPPAAGAMGFLPPGLNPVASGNGFSCGLTLAHGVKCWGTNSVGQLGNGTTTSSGTPVDVTGLASGVSQVVSGGSHTCALLTTGVVKCWGKGTSGELGQGSATNASTPVTVLGLSGITSLGVGRDHSCAVTASAGAKCWGLNASGQLGTGNVTTAVSPQTVLGLSNVASVVGGGDHTCAVTTSGGVSCWGLDNHGQLGDNSTNTEVFPQTVSGLPSSALGIALGTAHTCAILTSGSAYCWGANASGQLGLGSSTPGVTGTTEEHVPTIVKSGSLFGIPALASFVGESIWAGGDTTCAMGKGFLYCWGSNTSGATGTNSAAAFSADFKLVSGLGRFDLSSVAVGSDNRVCALHSDGSTRCWGSDATGGLGDGTTTSSSVPVTGSTPGTFYKATVMMALATSPSTLQFWNKVPVTVSFTCYWGYAPVSCPDPVTVGETAGQSVTATATDAYPSSASLTQADIRVDLTPPTLTGVATTPPNAAGWYHGAVTIDWTCGDALSGLQINSTCNDSSTSTVGASVTASKSVQDNAGNSTTTVVGPFKIDTTRPVTSASAPAWSNHDVALTLAPTDNLSGVASTTYSIDGGPTQTGTSLTVTGDGTHTVAYGSVDVAGNVETTKTLTVKIDGTPPSISGSAVPAANANGWNATDVTVSWLCGDGVGSGVASCSAPRTVTSEGPAQDITGQAVDTAGNIATGHVAVSIDKTAPTIAAVTPPVPESGWFTDSVPVSFDCNDPGGANASGIAVCSDGSTITGDGPHRTRAGLAVDAAGNTAGTQADVAIDTTPPIVTGSTTSSPSSAGWYSGSTTVHWTCSDATSGVVDCPPDEVVSALGTTTLSHTVVDHAGNVSAPGTVTVNIDDGRATSITPSVSPALNPAGWGNTPVRVHFACSARSGVASCSADQVVTGPGAGQDIVGQVVDNVGTTVDAHVTVSLDFTKPTVGVTGPVAGATYVAGSVPSPACTASDALSGIATAPTLDITGGGPTGLGAFTATCAGAVDNAGNTNSAAVSYTIVANTGTVAGTISSTTGGPLPDATVRLYTARNLSAAVPYSVNTDSAGHYALGAVSPGTYYLYTGKAAAAYPAWYPSPIVVVATQTVAADLALVPGAAGSGTVTGPSGPLVGATVRVVQDGNPTAKRVLTDAGGHYALSGMLAGTYTLLVTAYGYTPKSSAPFTVASSTAAVPSPDVEVVLAPITPGIRGVVSNPASGLPLAGCEVRAFLVGSALTDPVRTTTTAVDGSWSIASLPAGTYNVLFARQGAAGSAYYPTSVVVSAGGNAAVMTVTYDLAHPAIVGSYAPNG